MPIPGAMPISPHTTATSVMNIINVASEKFAAGRSLGRCVSADVIAVVAVSASKLSAAPHSQHFSSPARSWAWQAEQSGTFDEASGDIWSPDSACRVARVGFGQMSHASDDLPKHDARHRDGNEHDEFVISGHAKLGCILAK